MRFGSKDEEIAYWRHRAFEQEWRADKAELELAALEDVIKAIATGREQVKQ